MPCYMTWMKHKGKKHRNCTNYRHSPFGLGLNTRQNTGSIEKSGYYPLDWCRLNPKTKRCNINNKQIKKVNYVDNNNNYQLYRDLLSAIRLLYSSKDALARDPDLKKRYQLWEAEWIKGPTGGWKTKLKTKGKIVRHHAIRTLENIYYKSKMYGPEMIYVGHSGIYYPKGSMQFPMDKRWDLM